MLLTSVPQSRELEGDRAADDATERHLPSDEPFHFDLFPFDRRRSFRDEQTVRYQRGDERGTVIGSGSPVSSISPLTSPLPPPREVGRYLMFGVIASGGMAAVHYGLMNGPVGFRRTVAIKRLHEQFAGDPEFVSQFLDEARLAARIRHPNVVQTLDVVAEQRQLLLVMEYVDGETLARLLVGAHNQTQRIPIEQAVGIVAGALHGLHAAHEATDEHGLPLRIVHRDVSPQNILVGRDGVARVLDFGVAKAAARVHSTQGSKIKGKLRYMSPEQVGGAGVDRRTDVFAAGVVLWECLAGRRLFESKEGAAAIINQVLTKPIAPPSKYRTDVPPALDAVVLRALERDPKARYQSALDLAIALEDAVRIPSSHATGKWMKSIAGDDLDERAGVIARIEKHSTEGSDPRASLGDLEPYLTPSGQEDATDRQSPQAVASARASGSVPPTETMTVEERHARRKKAGLMVAVLASSALVGFFLVVRGMMSSGAHGEERAEGSSNSPIVSAAPPSAGLQPSAGEAKVESAVTQPAAPPAPLVDGKAVDDADKAPEGASAAPPAVPKSSGSQKTQSPARAPVQRAACANPTYVDEKGIRRFKVECL